MQRVGWVIRASQSHTPFHDSSSHHAGLEAAAPSACDATTDLLHKTSSAKDPLALEGFRLIAAFLRSCPSYQPTQQQVRVLTRWLRLGLIYQYVGC